MAGWKCPRCGVQQCSCQEKTASDGTKGCRACTPGYEQQLQQKKLQQIKQPLPPPIPGEPAGVIVNRVTFKP